MAASKISKAAQGTIEVIMRLVFIICLPVSTQKQLFTFASIVLCHLVRLPVSPPPSLFFLPLFISFSLSRPLSRSLLALLFLLITDASPSPTHFFTLFAIFFSLFLRASSFVLSLLLSDAPLPPPTSPPFHHMTSSPYSEASQTQVFSSHPSTSHFNSYFPPSAQSQASVCCLCQSSKMQNVWISILYLHRVINKSLLNNGVCIRLD